jgi:hypothetical protein
MSTLLRPCFALRVPGGDGDVVKDAEAHTLIGAGVVTWRPHYAKGVTRAALNDSVNRVQDATHSVERDIPGVGGHCRITG